MKKLLITLAAVTLALSNGWCQKIDLAKALSEKKLVIGPKSKASVTDQSAKAITFSGLVWLPEVQFTEGTIELDIKGTEKLQGSFPGVVFHAIDTSAYDAVYFRPFNFRAEDPVRRIHAVQYMALPDFDWSVLRETKNGVYEKAVTPAPAPTDWFHARIVVKGKEINVYVNDSNVPSLTVTKLNDRASGKFGLMNGGEGAQFANLQIHR